MKSVLGKVVFTIFSVCYPVLIFAGLYFKIQPRVLSLLLVIMAAFHFSAFLRGKNRKTLFLFAGLLGLVALVWVTNSETTLKIYPVLVNLVLLGVFGSTLFRPPSLVFRFALLQDKTLATSPSVSAVEKYCFKVTLVWCLFFVFNGSVSWATVFAGSEWIWSLYNGLISYILIGLLFLIEYAVRVQVRKKYPKSNYTPLSAWHRRLYPDEKILCFENQWEEKRYRTWGDFVRDTAALRAKINSLPYSGWILHAENVYRFLVAFTAVLQTGKKLYLTANRAPDFLREIREAETGILTDQEIADSFSIPECVKNSSGTVDFVSVSKDSDLFLYTSGTTGAPKAVHKKLFQFEAEGAELSFLWGEACLSRRFVGTVNHHHIYGLLFSALLPASLGVPFRSERIEIPESLKHFSREPLVLVSSPAFLKRLAESKLENHIFEIPPLLFSSGGVLPVEAAQEAKRITGTSPAEIYGSTETGGIAYRVAEKSLAWTPFRVNRMELTENGCLKVYSPYLNDPAGFTTGDLVEFNEDGSFILKGRIDSIVKIEEKRISLTEVESRIRATGLVQDVCVVALTGFREYLGAAVVLNRAGCEQLGKCSLKARNDFFKNYLSGYLERTVLPKKWRYSESLPGDTQGKIKRKEIEQLFVKESQNVIVRDVRVCEDKMEVLLTVPKSSDYYDGHFNEFHLLPAVVQIDLAIRFSHEYLQSSLRFSKISRVKFVKPVLPDTPICLEASYSREKGKITFNYLCPESRALFSSGVIFMEVLE
ncbi:MAG: AMP-binding protein [Fibrobacter sp.]|jgi:acyl-coenzyme A synthetase/AMP-(fatty) acid ligase/uncharacterized membrane protein|nr:AMP-binding protein [Fibrobacter sp.]